MTVRLLQLLAAVLIALGGTASIYLLLRSPDGPLLRAVTRYLAYLDKNLRFVRSQTTALRILLGQVAGTVAVVAGAALYSPVLLILEVLVIAVPVLHVRQKVKERIIRIDDQLDGWLLVLANALRAVPSIGDALASSQALVHPPIADELDTVLKEYQLGTPLDQALQNMGDRLESRVVATALTILQVARRTGGDLSTTLETSAASLREMARLEGVVRTKTADGRNQAWVIGSMPAVVVLGLQLFYPEMIEPLLQSTMGNVFAGIAFLLWAGGIAAAMRIMQVDI